MRRLLPAGTRPRVVLCLLQTPRLRAELLAGQTLPVFPWPVVAPPCVPVPLIWAASWFVVRFLFCVAFVPVVVCGESDCPWSACPAPVLPIFVLVGSIVGGPPRARKL